MTEQAARRNSLWQAKVRQLLWAGYGSEDIAIKLSCDAADVIREIQILRADGELQIIYDRGRK
jgi:hypothetical protein